MSSILTLFGGLRERVFGLFSSCLLVFGLLDFLELGDFPSLTESWHGRDSERFTNPSLSKSSLMFPKFEFFPTSDILLLTDFLERWLLSMVVCDRRSVTLPEFCVLMLLSMSCSSYKSCCRFLKREMVRLPSFKPWQRLMHTVTFSRCPGLSTFMFCFAISSYITQMTQ